MAQYKGTSADALRSSALAKARDAEARSFAEKQEAIRAENAVTLKAIESAFAVNSTTLDEQFKAATVGLVTAAQFKEKRVQVEQRGRDDERARQQHAQQERQKAELKRKSKLSALSFHADDDPDDASFPPPPSTRPRPTPSSPPSPPSPSLPKLTKNPDVSTDFLFDRHRAAEEERLRVSLRSEWLLAQGALKAQEVEITYSYWDGSGHRRKLRVVKGARVGQFLELVRRDCMDEFSELRVLSSDALLYVKEDLIIPHALTFYDLIVTKARGKSGPLFHFDVHDDVRMLGDARVEKDESHAGKVCTRAWYDRNQHIFPASRWEVYDPAVVRDKYTIKGGEVR